MDESEVAVEMAMFEEEWTDPDSTQVRYALEFRPSTIC